MRRQGGLPGSHRRCARLADRAVRRPEAVGWKPAGAQCRGRCVGPRHQPRPPGCGGDESGRFVQRPVQAGIGPSRHVSSSSGPGPAAWSWGAQSTGELFQGSRTAGRGYQRRDSTWGHGRLSKAAPTAALEHAGARRLVVGGVYPRELWLGCSRTRDCGRTSSGSSPSLAARQHGTGSRLPPVTRFPGPVLLVVLAHDPLSAPVVDRRIVDARTGPTRLLVLPASGHAAALLDGLWG